MNYMMSVTSTGNLEVDWNRSVVSLRSTNENRHQRTFPAHTGSCL